MSKIEYNEQQKEAIAKAVKWYRDYQDGKDVKPFFFLAGYAGTGKTTVAREIARQCAQASRIAYVAPTGKAASRLRLKGCVGAQTLHKFMYVLAGEIKGELEFVEKGTLEDTPLLIVADEVSMVNDWDGGNLLHREIPVLALGDLGQIPPVTGEPWLEANDCDYNLDIIERNGGNIVRAAFYIRTGGRLPEREYDDVKVYSRRYTLADVARHLDENSVMLCSYNSTRQLLNMKARIELGYSEMRMPQIGEKLLCTFNQHSYGFMNGEQCILLEIKDIPEWHLQPGEESEFYKIIKVKSLTDDEIKEVKLNLACFLGYDEEERKKAMRAAGGFDFGYALTIHKSQGSEWDNVMVVEEFLKGSPYHQLMYTAVTRAVKHLTVFRAAD